MEWYKTATELYTSSLRALEQRSGAFLLIQSFLIAGYVLLLTRCNNELNIFMYIIVGIGIITCFSFFIAGNTTSIDTAIWRSYMRMLEKNEHNENRSDELPWVYYNKEYRERTKGALGKLLRTALDKLPGPTLWLGLPAFFITAWICVLVALKCTNCHWFIYIIIFVAILIIAGLYYRYGIKDIRAY